MQRKEGLKSSFFIALVVKKDLIFGKVKMMDEWIKEAIKKLSNNLLSSGEKPEKYFKGVSNEQNNTRDSYNE